MDDTYIKVSAIQRKLKQAQEEHAVLYIHALGGYGKTAAIAYFLRNKAHLYLSGAEGVLNEAPPLNQIKQTTVVVDDISPIVSESSREYIRTLLTTDKQLILIGRTAAPHWLGLESLDRRYIIAAEPDFLFDATQTKKLMEAYHLAITDEQADQIVGLTQLLFVKLPPPNHPFFLQIKRRYRINYSDTYYVRLFYPIPFCVIIVKLLIIKEAGIPSSKV